MSVDFMDTLTFVELGALLDRHNERKKDNYEMIAHAVTVGYARTQTKKKIEMFPTETSDKVIKKVDKQQKQQEINDLVNEMNS